MCSSYEHLTVDRAPYISFPWRSLKVLVTAVFSAFCVVYVSFFSFRVAQTESEICFVVLLVDGTLLPSVSKEPLCFSSSLSLSLSVGPVIRVNEL